MQCKSKLEQCYSHLLCVNTFTSCGVNIQLMWRNDTNQTGFPDDENSTCISDTEVLTLNWRSVSASCNLPTTDKEKKDLWYKYNIGICTYGNTDAGIRLDRSISNLHFCYWEDICIGFTGHSKWVMLSSFLVRLRTVTFHGDKPVGHLYNHSNFTFTIKT